MSWTLCTSGSAIAKAGVGVNSEITTSGSILADWSDQVEGRIEAETRRSWVDNFSSLDTGIKNVLEDVSSSMIARQIIMRDLTGYFSKTEAITLLNLQDDVARDGLRILKDFKSNEIKTP